MLEWLSEENKQKKARGATVCGQLCSNILNGLNESGDSSISDSSEESLSTFLLLLSSSEIFKEPFSSLTTNILPALYDSYSFIRVANFCFLIHRCSFIRSSLFSLFRTGPWF